MTTKFPMIALGVLTAGAMLAQTATSPSATAPPSSSSQQSTPAHSHPRQSARNWQDRMLARMTMRLNLTPAQQMQVKGILRETRAEDQALAPQVRQERTALHAAIKSDALGQIDQITQQNVNVNAKMEANHLKTIAKIYAILTPDQKAKFDQRFDRARSGNHSAKGV